MRFLGHIIDSSGVATDPDKVSAIRAVTESDLMMEDGVTPSQRKIKLFLGMVLYYQRFIQNCSTIAKPICFDSHTKGQEASGEGCCCVQKDESW